MSDFLDKLKNPRVAIGLAAALVMVWIATFAAASIASARHINVVVNASLPTGQPVEELIVSLWHGDEPLTDGCTNSSGTCRLEGAVPDDVKVIEVRHAFAGNRSALPKSKQIELAKHLNTLRTKYAFQDAYTIALQPGVADYTLPITAIDGITVTGIVRDARQQPVAAMIMGPAPVMPAISKRGEPFALKGLPRSTSSTVFVIADSIVIVIPFSEEQTAEDVDLGNVVLPKIEGNRSLEFTLRSGVELRESGAKYQPGLLLIRIGEQWALTFKGNAAGPSDGFAVVKTPPIVPEGTYAVIPGWFLRAKEPAAMCEAAFLGADVRESGVPIIEVADGSPGTFEINVLDAWNSMSSWLKTREADHPSTAPNS